jgi:hypothetical protein
VVISQLTLGLRFASRIQESRNSLLTPDAVIGKTDVHRAPDAAATHSEGPYPVAPVVVSEALIGAWTA